MDWSRCPDIESKPDAVSGAWVVKEMRVQADGLVENAEDGFTPEEIAAEIYPTVTVAAARRIIAFARLPGHRRAALKEIYSDGRQFCALRSRRFAAREHIWELSLTYGCKAASIIVAHYMPWSNAFSYLFALEQSRNPEGKVDKDGLLRREGWKNWSKIKRYGNRSKDLADQDLAKMYRNGAYPNYVVGLAKYVNRVLFGERYYIGPHKRGLEALKTNDQNYLLHIVFVQQDKEDKLGHYISLINSADQMRSDYRCVLRPNRRYILWKLDGSGSAFNASAN